MAVTVYYKEMKRAKDGALVTPVDDLRSYESSNLTIASGNFPLSGLIYSIGSGKTAYVKQVIIGPSAVSGSWVKIADVQSGYQVQSPPLYNPYSKQTSVFDVTLGPFTSGICIASGSAHPGDVTLVVQVNPNVTE